MGQHTAAAVITAADFVTPPELAHLRLARQPAGRIGGVRLTLAADERGTHLSGSYQQAPLRLLALPPGPSQPTLVYLLNPTAGLLDGDGQLVQIEAAPATRTVVAGQSASRIHPAVHGFCTQQWQVAVHAGAVLVVLPGPAIPYQGSRYFQQVVVDLQEGAQLIWGDVWLAGRYARGGQSELFRFQQLIQDFTVRREGSLVYRDRFCWAGPWDEVTAAWHFGGQLAYGSLFHTGKVAPETVPPIAETRTACLETAAGDTVFRWLGSSAAVIAQVAQTALRVAANRSDPASAVPWLLTGNALAPNHWFTSWEGRS